jgi:hypothetical protein
MTLTDAAVIFPKSDIQHPMKLVLNAPMRTNGRTQLLRFTRQRRNVIAGFVAMVVVASPLAVNPDDTSQASPTTLRVKIGQIIGVTNGPNLTFFNPTMPFVNALGGLNRDGPTRLSQGIVEQAGHSLITMTLVIFQGQDIVSAL